MFQHVQSLPLPEMIETTTLIRTGQAVNKKAEVGRGIVATISYATKQAVGNPADYNGPVSGTNMTDEEHEAACEFYAALHEEAGIKPPVSAVGKDGKILAMIMKFITENWAVFLPYLLPAVPAV